MDIRALAEQYAPYIIERRRYYHQHPELSFKEVETTKSLVEDVKAMGLEVQTFPDYTGLIATLDTGRPGKTVMLRSDIDALPVKECTGLPSHPRTTASCTPAATTTTWPCSWVRPRSSAT